MKLRIIIPASRWVALRSLVLLPVLAVLAGMPARGATASVDEPAAAGERPLLGLALSGGGALGIAHVGVLQVLEDLQIPVDAIAGTSMGAIIGGLYASGVSMMSG